MPAETRQRGRQAGKLLSSKKVTDDSDISAFTLCYFMSLCVTAGQQAFWDQCVAQGAAPAPELQQTRNSKLKIKSSYTLKSNSIKEKGLAWRAVSQSSRANLTCLWRKRVKMGKFLPLRMFNISESTGPLAGALGTTILYPPTSTFKGSLSSSAL